MLFLKHIYRSIKKSPLQPIIILITLILSVSTFLTAVKIAINVAKETALYKNVDNYLCDITVKPSKNDDVRMLFTEDAEDIIGDAGIVLGEFNLSALYTRDDYSELVDISAAELLKSDAFYQFDFYEYGEFTTQNLKNSIILSSDLAGKFGIKVGDSISFSLLNKRMEFTVQAIGVGEGFLNDFEGIIDISAVSEAIAEANPAIASFAGNIIPYNILKIRINDPSRIDEFIDKLNSDERFNGKTIVKEESNIGSADFVHMLSLMVIIVCTSIIVIISGIVIFTALDMLSKKRLKDSALFMLSGANTSQLNRILYLECFIYGIISAVFGLFLSMGIYKKINTIFDWNTDDIAFKLYDIPIVFFAAPAIVLMTTFLHTLRAKKLSISERLAENSENKASATRTKPSLILLASTLLFVIPSILVEPKHRYIFIIPTIVCFLSFIFLFIPYLIDIISRYLIKALEKKDIAPPNSMLTLKNACVSYPLKHSGRLITLLLTLIITILICLNSLINETATINSIVDANYVAVGANEKSDKLVEDLDSVDGAFRLSLVQGIMTLENTAVLGISVDDKAMNFINPDLAPSALPKNDEIIITSGIANLENKKVGDSITLVYETVERTFKIIDVVKSSGNIIYLDVSYIGEKNQFLCIKTDVEKNSEEYRQIANLLETRGAMMMELGVIFDPITTRLISYSELLTYVVSIAFFTTLLGIINILVSSYFARKQERSVYYTVGMSKNQIRKIQLSEILYIFLIALISIPILTFALVLVLDVGMSSFGVDLFYL